MTARCRSLLVTVCVVLALAPAADAAYLLVKAKAAQILIARAWSTTGADDRIRPWPWADTQPVARLRVERLNLEAWVLSGATGNALAFGPGLAEGSGQPGQPGVAVIGGHRDTHFKPLQNIQRGDHVRVQSANREWHSYQVNAISIADSRVDSISMESDDSVLVLVTCYPFDAVVAGGPLRYVIEAQLMQSQHIYHNF